MITETGELKNKLQDILSKILHGISDDIVIGECYDLYKKVIKFETEHNGDKQDGLKYKLDYINNIVTKKSDTTLADLNQFIGDFEVFVKKLYIILDEFSALADDSKIDYKGKDSHMGCGAYLNNMGKIKRPIGSQGESERLHKITNFDKKTQTQTELEELNENLNKATIDERSELEKRIKKLEGRYSDEKIGKYFLDSVVLKNYMSHQSEDPHFGEMFRRFQIIMVSELYLIYFFKSDLENGFKIKSSESELFNEYVERNIDKLKLKSEKYVPLNLKEIPSIDNKFNFLDEIFKKQHQFQIIGKGGNGKTTSIENLFLKCLNDYKKNQNNELPILIPLSSIKDVSSNIVSEIAKKLQVDNEDIINEMISQNNLILFLDGLNEINSSSIQTKIIQEIKDLIDLNIKLKIIITTRDDASSSQHAEIDYFNIPIYIIQLVKKEQIKDFVIKYCVNEEEAQKVLNTIEEQDERILKLFGKPLLLVRAIEIIKEDQQLPDNENDMINCFIEKLLIREKSEKKDPKINIDFYMYILAGVASELQLNNNMSNNPVTKIKFIQYIMSSAKKIGYNLISEDSMSSDYIIRIGCELEIIAQENKEIKFFHQNYFEFFLAYYMRNLIGHE
tara:strand:+ start:12244 stop:14100 length:1857 start_codon:yes stop_codon:yes gene_type:complete